jgi:adenine specific DNA methylase Mod
LKETGSLYLHCDPTASHYLRMTLDAIFGGENFRNEIIWKRTTAHNSGKKFGPVHDTLFFYAKSEATVWKSLVRPLDESYIKSHYKYEENGRRYKRENITEPGHGMAKQESLGEG